MEINRSKLSAMVVRSDFQATITKDKKACTIRTTAPIDELSLCSTFLIWEHLTPNFSIYLVPVAKNGAEEIDVRKWKGQIRKDRKNKKGVMSTNFIL